MNLMNNDVDLNEKEKIDVKNIEIEEQRSRGVEEQRNRGDRGIEEIELNSNNVKDNKLLNKVVTYKFSKNELKKLKVFWI